MKTYLLLVILFLSFSSTVAASNYEITHIIPIFNDSTPGFGEFKVKVDIKSNVNHKSKIYVSCLYVGLTRPGVYYKNEPQIMKKYKVVEIESLKEKNILFEKGFLSYHPETLGELIISIVGTSVVRSIALKTRFHPRTED